MPEYRVAAVILNWRAAEMTLRAVSGVFAQTRRPEHVFVVENGSGDDSEAALRAGLAIYGDRVSMLVNRANLGFGGGCNTALRSILGRDFDACWLLNNDARPMPDCLAHLVAAAGENPSTGAVGSMLFDPAAAAEVHYGSRLDPVALVSHYLVRPGEIDEHRFAWLTAASLLISVPALQDVGLFDERYFMYWEDADLSMRMRRAGYRLVVAPDALVAHVAGTSSHDMAVRRYQWHLASQRLWLRKHHPLGRAMGPVVHAKYLLKALIDRDFPRYRALLNI